ncbi:MAG: hypothetical protein LBO04_02135 [Spirochaetaceae bacterium]|jgi:hypothetical protein|nr:hypothetical protein [Spirochaetaceae bacterium]
MKSSGIWKRQEDAVVPGLISLVMMAGIIAAAMGGTIVTPILQHIGGAASVLPAERRTGGSEDGQGFNAAFDGPRPHAAPQSAAASKEREMDNG